MVEDEIDKRISHVEDEVMSGLKDFQRATVERVDQLFRKGQDRVLVADEVGMGKTMIAKGVIAKFAKLRKEEGDDLVKVVYICSNQSIANQNISELDVFNIGYEDVANTRLSMQHLMIQKLEEEGRKNYIQLIPLTPETSFNQTSGSGNVNERYIMFLVLKQLPVFEGLEKELEDLMRQYAEKSWNSFKSRNEYSGIKGDYNYNSLVSYYENYTKRDCYGENDIFSKLEKENNFLNQVADFLRTSDDYVGEGQKYVIQLRKIFATISVDMLNPDLVIMDEFQRFQFLINNTNEETKPLIDKFFKASSSKSADRIRVLLLSATPYKLYSTLEELGDVNNDESYKEFYQVMNFLNDDEEKSNRFALVWNDLSMSLKQIEDISWDSLLSTKKIAEDEMYADVCRTERISVMENGDYTDDSTKDCPLEISNADVMAYIDANKLLENTTLGIKFPMDYIKSCPFALSFMNTYETKKKIRAYFEKNIDEINFAKSKLLWLNKGRINNYENIRPTNARLERLKQEIFVKQKTEKLLWIPPTKPYYEMQGVFKGKENYSKILIFSSWEMVPRMIASLISYEEEKLTISALAKRHRESKKGDKLKNTNYFSKRGYPYPRLVARNQGVLCLLYPSKVLTDVYNPLDEYREGLTDLKSLELRIKDKISALIPEDINNHVDINMPVDSRWYYILPMYIDGLEYLENWENGVNEYDFKKKESNKDKEAELVKLIADSINIISTDDWKLGKIPDDILDVMVNMAIASPSVCFNRDMSEISAENPDIVFKLAYMFINYLNSRTNTAIIELAIDRHYDEGNFWRNTLIYCKQGNFQATIDEYIHLLTRGNGINEKNLDKVQKSFEITLGLNPANYKVESFSEFKNKIINKGVSKNESVSSLRTHFAVAFSKGESKDNEQSNRKDILRTAFNSPFWPFVLSSTSIGQEGLDFHLYCRKIMHWNLPGNPIDLEQREGRINRFKCLAIRQNVVRKYGDVEIPAGETDIWNTLFKAAEKERKEGQSELIPYWCFGENQEIKIERILANYPLSIDEERYDRLIKILSLYRLTMGQPRQEELLTHIFKNCEDIEKLKELFIDLSPYSKLKKIGN